MPDMAMDNSLMPQGAGAMPPQDVPQAPQSGASPQPVNLMAQYAKLQKAEEILTATGEGLAKLADLGDTVTPEDVVTVAGGLVAKGLDPTAMATLLADMPQKGDLLAQWVQGHLQQVGQRKGQLDFVTASVRQHIGREAIQELMMHHLDNTGELENAGV